MRGHERAELEARREAGLPTVLPGGVVHFRLLLLAQVGTDNEVVPAVAVGVRIGLADRHAGFPVHRVSVRQPLQEIQLLAGRDPIDADDCGWRLLHFCPSRLRSRGGRGEEDQGEKHQRGETEPAFHGVLLWVRGTLVAAGELLFGAGNLPRIAFHWSCCERIWRQSIADPRRRQSACARVGFSLWGGEGPAGHRPLVPRWGQGSRLAPGRPAMRIGRGERFVSKTEATWAKIEG